MRTSRVRHVFLTPELRIFYRGGRGRIAEDTKDIQEQERNDQRKMPTFADRPPSATGNAMVGVHWVSPSWFSAMRVPLIRGRLFTEEDRLETQKVVLINEEAARKYFPGEDPIGKRVAVYQGGFDAGAEVIGIVGDVRFGTIDSLARPDAYISYGQARITRMVLFVRTAGILRGSHLASAMRYGMSRRAFHCTTYSR